MGCIYLIKCEVSGKQYVGLTKFSAKARFAGHLHDAIRDKATPLHRAIRKYGAECFTLTTLFESDDRDVLCLKEQDYIVALNTRVPDGYNVSGGGEAPWGELNPRFGTRHSEETKQKMRDNNAMNNPVHRAKIQGVNHGMYGKTHSAEARVKMGKKRGSCVKMHEPDSLTENNVEVEYVDLFIELGWVRGRPPMSNSWRVNMSRARVGLTPSSKTKLKMTATRLNNGVVKNAPKVAAISNLMQVGFTLREVGCLLFMTRNQVKGLRRWSKIHNFDAAQSARASACDN